MENWEPSQKCQGQMISHLNPTSIFNEMTNEKHTHQPEKPEPVDKYTYIKCKLPPESEKRKKMNHIQSLMCNTAKANLQLN